MTLTLTRNHKAGATYRDLSVAARAIDASKVYGKGEKAAFDWNRV